MDKSTESSENYKENDSVLHINEDPAPYSNPYFDWIPQIMRIPSDELKMIPKILLGFVIKLQSGDLGYCNAKNDYFAAEMGVDEQVIKRAFSTLKSKKYLTWRAPSPEQDSGGHWVKRRKIYLTSKCINLINSPSIKNDPRPSIKNDTYSTFGTTTTSKFLKSPRKKKVKKDDPPKFGIDV